MIFGARNKIGRDLIGYAKVMPDGSIAYVEEKRTGKKKLSAVTMYKYPATLDVDRIADNLRPNVRNDSGGTEAIVVRGPNADKNDLLYQSGEGGQPRGWFRTLPDGSFEIGKTKIGDLSTFVHEPAHAYLYMLRDLANREGSSDTLKSDYSKVLHFLGAKDGETLTTEQHEKWAEANEQYLREGKAPSPGLRGVFMRFSVWLGSVYKKATDLGVQLSPEIRDVFDRMYAAEDGVNKAARSLHCAGHKTVLLRSR